MICRLHSPVESLESAPTDVQQSFLSKIISCPHKSFAVFRVLCVAAGRAFGCFIHFNKTLYQRWKSIKNQQKNNTIGISPPSDRILSHDLLSSSSQYSYCADWQAKTREVVLSLHLRMKWRRKDPWNRNWIKLINFRLYQQSTCSTTTTFRFPFSPWWIIWPPRRTRPLNWTLQNINKYVYPFRFPSFLYKKKKIVRKGSVSIFFYKWSNLPALSPGPWSSDYLCDGRGRWTRSSCESDHSSCRTSQQENCMSVQTRRGCSLAYLCDWKELQRHHHAEEHESQLELGRQRMAPPFSLMA